MDIHKPKPIHSWREFATEIGVIVIGILIALGLEQAVESWHERSQAEEAREAIQTELRFNISKASWILEMQDCSERQLSALSEAIGRDNQVEVRRQMAGLQLQGPISWGDAAFQAALASNVSSRFSAEEQRYYPVIYGIVASLADNQSRYLTAYGRLRAISEGGLSQSASAASAELTQMAELTEGLRGMQAAATATISAGLERLGLRPTAEDRAALPLDEQVAACKAVAAALESDG